MVLTRRIKSENSKIKIYMPFGLLMMTFILFLFTRFWQLRVLPYGYHIDEAGMAYDAWCLAEYGVDRYLKAFPLYLKNFGGGQSVLYAYITAFLFKIFGYHEILIRIPGVLFSALTFIFGVLLTKKIFAGRPYLPIGTGLLITICPYFILASRFGLDCNLMLGASTVFLYFLLCAISEEKIIYYVLAGITAGIVLYTYALSYLILPIFMLYVLVYTIRSKKFELWNWVAMALPLAVLAAPLIAIQAINILDLPEWKVGVFTLTKLDEYRGDELSGFRWIYLKPAIHTIFIGDTLNYNSIEGIPNLYGVSIPLLIIGFFHSFFVVVRSLIKGSYEKVAIIFGWFLSVLFVMSCTIANVNRMNAIYFTAVIFVVDAIAFVGSRIKGGKRYFLAAVIGLYTICFLYLGKYYYGGEYAKQYESLDYFDVDISEAVEFIDANPQYGKKGIQMSESAVYYALGGLISPYELQFQAPDQRSFFDGYVQCGTLNTIEEGYYYIVRNIFKDYANELRIRGFTEIQYTNYSLFYSE